MLLTLGACLAWARAASATDEVVVSGERSDKRLRESPYPVTVVDVRAYADRAIELNEVLERQAGVRVRQTGGAGTPARISVRGLEGRRVGIYLNGRPLDTPDGTFGINDLPLAIIERVEIYKGLVPAELGGDGLGSAINIVTNESPRDYVDAGYSLASYDVHRVFGLTKTWDRERRFAIETGVIGTVADNDYEMPLPDGRRVRREHDRYAQMILGAGIDVKTLWFDKAELELAYVRSRKELQGVPFAGTLALANVQEAQFTNTTLSARLNLDKRDIVPGVSLRYTFVAPVFLLRFRDLAPIITDFDGIARANPNGSGEVGFGPNDSRDHRIDLRQRTNLRWTVTPSHALNLNHFGVRTFDRPNDAVADRAAGLGVSRRAGDVTTSTTGLTHEGSFLDKRLATVLGAKHFFFASSGQPTSIYEIVARRALDTRRQSQHALGGNVGARMRFLPWLLVKAGYEYAARLPSTQELFGNGFTIQGNIALRPERSHNVSGGLAATTSSSGRTQRAEVTAFASRVEDLVTLTGPITPAYANIGRAAIRGVEADVRLEPTRWLGTYGNVTYQDVRNDTPFVLSTTQPNPLRGLRVPNVPWLFGSAGIELHGKTPNVAAARTRVFYDTTFVTEYFWDYELSRNQSRRVPAYLAHSIGLQQQLAGGRYSIDIEAVDLTNVRRFDDFNRPLPGRTFRVFFRTTFLD